MTKDPKKYHKLTTSDGVEIAGNYTPGSSSFGAVLLHAMPTTKEAYSDFAEKLAAIGLHSIAIDFRGHGESGGGNYSEFSDEEHQKYALDLQTAIDFLKSHDPNMKIGIVGASIGANIAIQYAVSNPVSFLVLLSPGLNYRGVNAGEMVVKLPETLPVYFATATDDERVPGNSLQAETMLNACSSKVMTMMTFREGGHGTELLEKAPNFPEDLVEWINLVKI